MYSARALYAVLRSLLTAAALIRKIMKTALYFGFFNFINIKFVLNHIVNLQST